MVVPLEDQPIDQPSSCFPFPLLRLDQRCLSPLNSEVYRGSSVLLANSQSARIIYTIMDGEPSSTLTYPKQEKTVDGYFKTYPRLVPSLPSEATCSYRHAPISRTARESLPQDSNLDIAQGASGPGPSTNKARQSIEERRIQPSSRRNLRYQGNDLKAFRSSNIHLPDHGEVLRGSKDRSEPPLPGRASLDRPHQPASASIPRTQTDRYSLSQLSNPSPSRPHNREFDPASFDKFVQSVPHIPPYYRSSSAPNARHKAKLGTSSRSKTIDIPSADVIVDSADGCIPNELASRSFSLRESAQKHRDDSASSSDSAIHPDNLKDSIENGSSSSHEPDLTTREVSSLSVDTRMLSISRRSQYHLPTSGRSNLRSSLSYRQEIFDPVSTLPDHEHTPPNKNLSPSNQYTQHDQNSSVITSPTSSTPDHTLFLRLPRFNRVLTLQRPPYESHQVSFSDIGAANGHPVFVFLGLGGIRYLTVLFEDLATMMNLRLICVDRWGLGKTDEVPAERRGFIEWAKVIEEVADELGIDKFGILAHSAGSPYAMAVAATFPERLIGSVNLLAPWVGSDIDGGYKWLKYVPTTLIKATQAAEWKMQGWMLGKASNPVPAPSTPRSTLESHVSTSSKTTEGSVRSSQESYTSTESVSSPQSRPVAPPNGPSSPPIEEQSLPSGDTSLSTALLRACHAENGGRTEDLLAIMRKATMWGFSYTDVRSQVNVWYGDRDDRISEKSILWMEKSLPNCQLFLRPGESHDLLSSTHIVLEVLERLAEDASN